MARFSKCPTWWVRCDAVGFKKFSGGENAGTSIAALKCIFGISTSIDFHTRKAIISLSDLESLTGLSRPMVVRGLKLLTDLGIVVTDKTRRTYEYELTVSSSDEGWGKIPYERIRKQLPGISNRGVVPLTALKIYFLLISIRPNDSNSVSINYDNLIEYLGCQRRHIRPALDILYSHKLIMVTRIGDDARRLRNSYTLLGIKV